MKIKNHTSGWGFCFMWILVMVWQVSGQSFGAERSWRAISNTPQLLKVVNGTDYDIRIMDIRKDDRTRGDPVSPPELDRINARSRGVYSTAPGNLGRVGPDGNGPGYLAELYVLEPGKDRVLASQRIQIPDEGRDFVKTFTGIKMNSGGSFDKKIKVKVDSSDFRLYEKDGERFVYVDKNVSITED